MKHIAVIQSEFLRYAAAMSAVQQKLVDACQPLIDHAVKKQTELLNNLLTNFVEYAKRQPECIGNKIRFYRCASNFLTMTAST